MEALSGIPGSTGATPVQNVGAYGQEVAQTITAVRVFDRAEKTRAAADPGRVRVRLPRQPAQARARALRRPRGRVRPGGRARCPGRSATRSWRAPSAWRSGSARRWPRSARRCSGCAAARGWSGTPPTPTRAAPARSSPTRSSRPNGPSRAARAGRPARGRSSSAPPGWCSTPASAAAPATGHVGTSSRHSLALTTEDGATATELLAFADRIIATVQERFGVTPRPRAHRRPPSPRTRLRPGGVPRSSTERAPPAARGLPGRGVDLGATDTRLSPRGGPCAGRPGRGGGRP